MSILYTQCLPTELAKPANQVVTSGAGVPASAPTGAVRFYVDTTTTPDSLYYWTGTAWTLVGDGVSSGGGGGGTFTCTDVVSCITARPTGVAATTGTLLLGNDGSFHAFPSGGGFTPFATNAEAQAGVSTTVMLNPANLTARDGMPAVVGKGNDVSILTGPSAGESAWGQNLLGETLHYAPLLGWKVVANKYSTDIFFAGPFTTPTTETVVHTFVVPRSGVLAITGYAVFHCAVGEVGTAVAAGFTENGLALVYNSTATQPIINGAHITVNVTYTVVAGDVLTFRVSSSTGSGTIYADACKAAYSYVD